MSQYALPLALAPVFSADNFIVSRCNQDAWSWIERWPDWPSSALLLHGPEGCGKTHLGRSWAGRAEALVVTASQLTTDHSLPPRGGGLGWGGYSKKEVSNKETPSPYLLPQGEGEKLAVLLEDIGNIAEERSLLHFLNSMREQGRWLLLTSKHPASQLAFTLPDLTSRLRALSSVAIDQPDDTVLAGAIRKQFTDRQLPVEDETIGYLVARMERSLHQAQDWVTRIDGAALAQHKSVTIPFVRRLLNL